MPSLNVQTLLMLAISADDAACTCVLGGVVRSLSDKSVVSAQPEHIIHRVLLPSIA